MINTQALVNKLKDRRNSLKSKKQAELRQQVKELRTRIVRLSFSNEPNLELHKRLMNDLTIAKEQIL